MKKILSIVIMTALLISGISVSGNAAQERTLSILTRPALPVADEEFDAILEEFKALMAEKGISLGIETNRFSGPEGDFSMKVTLQLKSGRAPDLLIEETGRGQSYMKAGLLLPLNPYIENWPLWEQVYAPFQKRMQRDGQIYMIPIQTCSIPIYYRKDIFEKAGLSPDWDPRSWNDIIAAAEQVKNNVQDVTPLLLIGSKEAGGQVTFSRFNLFHHGAGGTMYDPETGKLIVASEPLLDTFKFYEEIATKGLIDPARCVSAQANDWSVEAFQMGKGAINIYGSWAYIFNWGPGKKWEIPNIEEIVGYVKVPAKEPGSSVRGQDFVNQAGGWNYMIPKSSTENADLVWELIAFLSQADRQAHFNASKGQVATRADVTTSPIFQENVFLAEVSTWIPYTYIEPRDTAGWLTGPQQGISDALARIMIGDRTAEEAMKQFANDMERKLGKDHVMYKYQF